ncbi:MAG: DEAD/DEAH box helicase family protein [Candidatus Aenigmarchaeota archaeon]|nr:DEAD/DEAH box helicase family protein [Candidatus Aenigmarchaeota archaeon]MDW8149506.1 DEAD/DEAH box helicase family protein [Candidatus Aenigmarchaeota archaeon]
MNLNLSLLKNEKIEKREYQLKIASSCKDKNSLIVLPTGLGKTIIALMVISHRLSLYPESKILILAPTRPLCAQQYKASKENLNLDENSFALITGKIHSEKRKILYEKAKIIVSTPQTIENDIKNNIFDLSNISLLVVDEAHRSVGNYSYTFIAREYRKISKFPLIIGLTASPSEKIERIKEIKEALSLEHLEIRTEKDYDVAPYVKKVYKTIFYVDLPEKYKEAIKVLAERLDEDFKYLKEKGILKEDKISRKILIESKDEVAEKYINEGNPFYLHILQRISETIKIFHAAEILETQGITPFISYLDNLFKSKKRTDKSVVKDIRIRRAFEIIKSISNGIEHPKFEKLLEIVKKEIENNPKIRIIIFANFRDTVLKINEFLNKNSIKSEILIGQAIKKGIGLKQEKQIEILKKFENNEFNCLVCSSIGEEGLDFTADIAIFYDEAPSAIRAIQRRGRVGRKSVGRIIYLITKSTLDEIFYWSSFHKERKMRSLIYKMKGENSLMKFLK